MHNDWSDERYMDWADQERLVREDIEEIERKRRKQKAEAYKEAEYKNE